MMDDAATAAATEEEAERSPEFRRTLAAVRLALKPKRTHLDVTFSFGGECRKRRIPVPFRLADLKQTANELFNAAALYVRREGVVVAVDTEEELRRTLKMMVDKDAQLQITVGYPSCVNRATTSTSSDIASGSPGASSSGTQASLEGWKNALSTSVAPLQSATSSGFGDLISIEENDDRRPPTNWRQGRCLGGGSFGRVYICYDIDSDREIAVKRVAWRPENGAAGNSSTWSQELRLHSTLRHPRIVEFLGVTTEQNELLIFMEYMVGGSVKDVLTEYGPLKLPMALKYTGQMLDALHYLHTMSVVHRDVKTANILRDAQGNVKIADFGSATSSARANMATGNEEIDQESDQNTVAAGTAYYMAPEVAAGKPSNWSVDIWSLGVCLHEMATGKTFFSTKPKLLALLEVAQLKETPNLGELDKMPVQEEERARIKLLLREMLRVDANKRPRAKELLDKYKDLLSGVSKRR